MVHGSALAQITLLREMLFAIVSRDAFSRLDS